ncbi:class I SAM-dependent DNA methyltransferase [Streptomyces sp. BE308]|uniref:class I SAM-dependent DNA methyltransferase n=1 Tax=Streptomyces sp. BE308 TaxID=3002529 RepID=UPI002E7A25CE|nr:class I SAM-dependent DNA methyltransferase [Streptomyces sp. BE308]MEE1793621.1 class I SAM-dependent DNA methyltransferase [Streptomyces sp. BE308]
MAATRRKAAEKAPVTTQARLASLIKSARDTMRKDAGMNGDLDRLPQLSWLLFLKAFEERVEEEGEALDPGGYRRAIEKPYRWTDWATDEDLSGNELKTFVNDKLIPYLAGLGREADWGAEDPRNVISLIFKDVVNRMQSGTLLRDLVNIVNKIHFISHDDIHTMAFVYESILREMRDAAGDSGEFYTPRPVNRFMVRQSFLELGDTILDPACGTGGFLVQAHEELAGKVKTETEQSQLHANLKGIEKKPLPYLLASMNLLLHGVHAPRLRRENALLTMRNAQAADKVDVVLTNPPFGGEEESSVVTAFPSAFQTQETAWLFLYSILDQLKLGGRCAIVLPNGSLFASGENSIGAKIKKKLMKECNLHTVVRLPQGVFAPYTQIPSNILFFEKTGPTRDVWFYEIPLPEGRRGYTKTKPQRLEEYDDCVAWWGGKSREGREAGERAWSVPASEIIADGYNLDRANPHIGDELAHRTPEELVNDLVKTEEEILELLQGLKARLRETSS